jgi:hypothetical protein
MGKLTKKKSRHGLKKISKKTLKSTNKYVSVEMSHTKKNLAIKARLKKTGNVSAVHIHQNKNGKPGPILSWIATTPQWQAGVLQNKVNINKPCCAKENKCSLIAPKGTKKVKSNITIRKRTKIPRANGCKGIKPGVFLVVHGKKFKYMKKNKTLSKGKPQLDVIKVSKFN